MYMQKPPRQNHFERLARWWNSLGWNTRLIVVGLSSILIIAVLISAINRLDVLDAPTSSTASPTFSRQEESQFRDGWDHVMGLHQTHQMGDACSVILQAVSSQGSVFDTWVALNSQTRGDAGMTYAFFAGSVAACEHIDAR